MVGETPVDTGFIVYNEETYPNLTALFANLEVPTQSAEMSFAVSLDDGRLEYAGTDLGGLFAQKRNLVSPRFWSMLRDLERFYRLAPRDLPTLDDMPLGSYLDRLGCGQAFRQDHLYPMAAAIWSTPVRDIPYYPAAAFIRFCENHGLLKLGRRPQWRTVTGGSRAYVQRLTASFADRIVTGQPVRQIRRGEDGVHLHLDCGEPRFDHVVIATHADQALALLADADGPERHMLGAFGYRRNEAVLHADPRVMPKRRRVWSSWNYASQGGAGDPDLSVTYWMNRLQGLPGEAAVRHAQSAGGARSRAGASARDLSPPHLQRRRRAGTKDLWSLQGERNTWFAGAYFGAGFHEDGLQAGLAVAEELGGVRRPWLVRDDPPASPCRKGRRHERGERPLCRRRNASADAAAPAPAALPRVLAVAGSRRD
jgi:predicted NAD/FAD-binding protein